MTVHTNLRSVTPADFLARISIHHWQLRDLLCRGQNDALLYISQNSVNSFALSQREEAEPQVVASFGFEPRCLNSQNDLICVGGQENGQFSVCRNGHVRSLDLGGSINNNICLYEDQAIVSNNDHTLKHVDLASTSLVNCTALPTAVNHTSISPSESNLISVGDRSELYYFSRSSGGWSITERLEASTDSLFTTGFHPTRPIFAAGSQDGSLLLWDQRFLSTPFKIIYSTRPHQPSGAVRSIKFSPAPLDLLLFTEASGYAHLVDIRGELFEEELLRVGRREIAGCCWRSDGARLYVGCADGISEWSISGRDRLVFPAVKLQ